MSFNVRLISKEGSVCTLLRRPCCFSILSMVDILPSIMSDGATTSQPDTKITVQLSFKQEIHLDIK